MTDEIEEIENAAYPIPSGATTQSSGLNGCGLFSISAKYSGEQGLTGA